VHLEWHQQLSFTLKIHQNIKKIVGGWGFAPDPTVGAYSAPQTPYSWIKKATSKGKGKRREGNRRKGEVSGGGGRDFGPSQCWKQIDVTDYAIGASNCTNY